ncbi:MAG: ABC transporter permease, partial [Nitrospirales bacterium]
MPLPDLSVRIDDPSPSSRTKTVLLSRGRAHRRLRAVADRIAAGVVWVGGLATIVSIMGIFVYLLLEVIPLFVDPVVELQSSFFSKRIAQDSQISSVVGIDQYQEVAYLIQNGRVRFYQVPNGSPIALEEDLNFSSHHVMVVARSHGRGHHFAFGTDDGHIVPVDIELTPTFQNDIRTVIPTLTKGEPVLVDPTQTGIARLAYQETDEGMAVVVLTQSGELWLTKSGEMEGLMLSDEPVLIQNLISKYPVDGATALLLDSLGETVMLGAKDGQLLQWSIQDPTEPEMIQAYKLSDRDDFITALAFLIGDQSLAVGTNQGRVSVWMPVPNVGRQGTPLYQEIREFASHQGPVTNISPSRRDKGFVSADSTGEVFLHHSTSTQTLLRVKASDTSIQGLMFAPKANGVVTFDAEGQLHSVEMNSPHPEITAQALFRPVLYEGYAESKHIWQSSSGSDDFEPKFGMWPLIFGTLKGTIYAMFLAVPLAVMGAVYTGMFMSPRLRGVIKPMVETMAALPSVVLGFLAGLWLAPLLEEIFPAVVGMMIFMPLTVALACVSWQAVPRSIQTRGQSGIDLAVLTVVVLATAIGCLMANHSLESWLFGADYKGWLQSVFGLQYDQRNALVISLAMGFAVIPIIFSISEDSIANVPKHLIAGSLAMGATQWQTLTKLVLISASPGIFSA